MTGLSRRIETLERLFGRAIAQQALDDEPDVEESGAVTAAAETAPDRRLDPEEWRAQTMRVAAWVVWAEDALEQHIPLPDLGDEHVVRQRIRALTHSCAPPLGPFCASCNDWMPSLQFDPDGMYRCTGCGGLVGSLPPRDCRTFGHQVPCHCGYDYARDLRESWFWPYLDEESQVILLARTAS